MKKFYVYIMNAQGRKTKGTYWGKQRSALNRMAKLMYLVSSQYTVVVYNTEKRKIQRMHCGLAKGNQCLLSLPYARVQVS